MNEQEIEKEINNKGLNAPRISPESIDSTIKNSIYFQPEGTALTICAIELINGFFVVGHSASVSLENFDKELGEKIAYTNAREKIWSFKGFLLKEMLFKNKKD